MFEYTDSSIIQGVDRSQYPSPPSLTGSLTAVIISAIRGIEGNKKPRTHFPRVKLGGTIVGAEQLLPTEIRKHHAYGYSMSDIAYEANCHLSSIMIARPHTLNLMRLGQFDNVNLEHYLLNYFDRTTKQPSKGIGMIYQGDRLVHSVVYVSPHLVWDKPGKGWKNPLLLRDWSEVLAEWSFNAPSIGIMTHLKYLKI